ncbi:MAG: V-type ATP synthase subunit D, partial [Gemmatimonadota bacterium]
VRRLGEAVSRASRQLRTLEHQLAPRVARQIAAVRQQLDEREREERLRLKHVQHRRSR